MIGVDGEIKLIDFGLSYFKKKGEKVSELAGTPYYMAPEILLGEYGFEVDIWSIGVLLYILVSGYLPFFSDDREIVFEKIRTATYSFDHKEFESVSDECKELIARMLDTNRKSRIKGKEILEHPWFIKFLDMEDNDARN